MPVVIDLSGRVSLVTGAARGLGAAIATRLASVGAIVVIADINLDGATSTAQLINDASYRAYAKAVDVRDLDSIEQGIGAVCRDLGPVSILVNNAGVLRNAPLADMTLSDWDLVLDTHLRGAA